MLTSQVIFLKLKSGNPDNVNGNHIHGFFFKEILGSQNPRLADYLHLPDSPKPFSLSYIYKENQIYWFRIASWMDEIAKAVFSYFNSHVEITLNDCVFELIKTSTDKTESSWAERIDVADFIRMSKSMGNDVFSIEHCSPTSFKRGDSHLSLPVPELIVNSIYKQLPLSIKEEIHIDSENLINMLQLKEHRIRSVYNRKNYGSIASFEGKTRWQIDKQADQEKKEAVWLLFNFAFYSGIGVKTTQGMGMCSLHFQMPYRNKMDINDRREK